MRKKTRTRSDASGNAICRAIDLHGENPMGDSVYDYDWEEDVE